MFTGIVQATGIITKQENTKQGRLISIKTNSKIVRFVSKGGSVSIDGVCLSTMKKSNDSLFFELMTTTMNKTMLGEKKIGDVVNIEPAMLAGQPIGGHFISGHVDGIGVVKEVKKKWHTRYISISLPKKLLKYFIPQGSVVVNGVSLTVVEVKRDSFSVALVDYTLKHTNLINIKKGDRINIEVDLLAKYLEKFLKLK